MPNSVRSVNEIDGPVAEDLVGEVWPGLEHENGATLVLAEAVGGAQRRSGLVAQRLQARRR